MRKDFTTEDKFAYQQEHAAIIEKAFDEQGWSYTKVNPFQFKLAFVAPPESKITRTIHLVTAYPDRIFISSATNITVREERLLEVLTLLNFLNAEQINYGRFVLSKALNVWFDIGTDLLMCDLDEEMCCRALGIVRTCIRRFGDDIFDVAVGHMTAEEAISKILSYDPIE